jgi:hypothetical protein
MTRVLLIALLGLGTGCASNRNADESGARIQDTTLTPADTTSPNDTLPHIRDSVMDSAR